MTETTLDAKLRALAAEGELTYLSVCPVAGGFSASYSAASSWGNSMERDPDPVVACLKAITNYKPDRNGPRKPKSRRTDLPGEETYQTDEFGL